MLPALQALKDLHDLDQAILALVEALESGRIELASREEALLAEEKALDAARGGVKDAKAQEKLKEVELKSVEDQILSWTVKLNTTRDNKEYQAIQHQIGTFKAQKGALEEEILGMLDSGESVQADVSQEEGKAREARAAFEAFKREIEGTMARQSAEAGGLKSRRPAAASAVPEDAGARYERIRSARKGVGMAAAVDGACQGCHMSLTPNQANQLLQEKQLVTCQSCSRILYPG